MFESLLDFAQKASPTTGLILVILILGFIMYQLFIGKITLKISKTQDKRYPQMLENQEEHYREITDKESKHYKAVETLIAQNNTLLNNHFKHEIPEILSKQDSLQEAIERVEQTVKEVATEGRSHGDRLTRVETLLQVIREK